VESGQVVVAKPSGPSRGRLVATYGSAPVARVRVDIRNGSCSHTYSTMYTRADGSFPIEAYPGTYCAVPRLVPNGYRMPRAVKFTVRSGQSFTANLKLAATPTDGRLVARYGSAPVAGVKVAIRDSTCSHTYSTMATRADGSFPIEAFPGTYCAVPQYVPDGYRMPEAARFTVGVGADFTASVPLRATPTTGELVATDSSYPVAGVRVDIRDGSCSHTFSTMATHADGSFPIEAFPGTYCAVPQAVPAGYQVPSPVIFSVDPGEQFTASVQLR
jgi:hypothetical protein